jgi:hypothetical protein
MPDDLCKLSLPYCFESARDSSMYVSIPIDTIVESVMWCIRIVVLHSYSGLMHLDRCDPRYEA